MKKVCILGILILINISLCACVGQGSAKEKCGECPQFAPPPPGWCEDGIIIPGLKDECGCQMPPKCEKKPEEK